MRVAVTGTPGTGKTTVTNLVDTELDVIHVNDRLAEWASIAEYDPVRDSDVIDLDALRAETDSYEDVLFESHLAHYLAVDLVVVLRCDPRELSDRLQQRGMSARSIDENTESEALDVILTEAVERHGRDAVHEIDTTDRTPSSVAEDLSAILAEDRSPGVGHVDFTGYL